MLFSWGLVQFLLSASMDKTVRLWHVTVSQCLRVFLHDNYGTPQGVPWLSLPSRTLRGAALAACHCHQHVTIASG